MNPDLYNGLALAYIGDAYFELQIRLYLLEKGYAKVNDLHKLAISYTNGHAQCQIINYLLDNKLLSDRELAIFKKGRNCSSSQNRKNISLADYLKATGFEAVIGYLVLSNNNKRLTDLIAIAKNIVENKDW